MLNQARRYWNEASMFVKTYIMAVLCVGGIVCTGEGLESGLSFMVGGTAELSDLEETWVWIAATFIPAAFGAYWLTRCFLRPLERVSLTIKQLTEGKLHTRITSAEILRGDELGVLARALNHMAERIEHVVENERSLLAAISHELRSPLTRLSLCVELLRRRGGPLADDVHLQRLELETGRMNELISQLLDYARREMTPQSREMVDFRALVENVAVDAAFEGKELGVVLEMRLPDTATLHGNSLLLRQAVDNVVRNALRYAPADSTVHITLTAETDEMPGGYCLTVRDHGPGVPESMVEDIFIPFFRVNADRARGSGGTGMGLYLVEQAVRLHNGKVHAINMDDGGLLVGIRLPEDDNG